MTVDHVYVSFLPLTDLRILTKELQLLNKQISTSSTGAVKVGGCRRVGGCVRVWDGIGCGGGVGRC